MRFEPLRYRNQTGCKTVQRELTCWRERSNSETNRVAAFPEEELKRIAAAYDAAVPNQEPKKHRFSGVFGDQMPNDVGGSGSYTHWNTALGSTLAYVERFRGNDDLAADVEMRLEATERLFDLLSGWLLSKLEGEAGCDKLEEFLQGRFRRDLRNLSLYSWAYEIGLGREKSDLLECFVRIGQYLVERSYFTPDQLPMLTRAMQELEHQRPARLFLLIQRFVASRMGIPEDQPIPPSLQFLADETVLQASVNDYLRQTDDFKRVLDQWEREKAVNPEAKKPAPTAVFDSLITRAFLPNFRLATPDQLNVKLEAANEPFYSNGQWDEQARQVRWSRHMHGADSDLSELPTLLYALWSVPRKQEQKARFGKVVLEGASLGHYCLWYRGLSAAEAKEWNKLVASLRPSADLVKRIQAFRFAHESALGNEEEGGDLAATPRALILTP